MANRNAAAEPSYRYVLLDHVDRSELDGEDLIRGSRKDMVGYCRANHLPQKYITPYHSRWGYGWLLVGPTPYAAEPNTILLRTTRGWKELPLRLGGWGYHIQCIGPSVTHPDDPGRNTPALGLLLDAIEADYPPGSLTAALASSLTEVVRLVVTARSRHHDHIDGRALDQALTQHLLPYLAPWLSREREPAADPSPPSHDPAVPRGDA